MLGIKELNMEIGAAAIAIEELCEDAVGLDIDVVGAALRHSGGGMALPPGEALGLAPL